MVILDVPDEVELWEDEEPCGAIDPVTKAECSLTREHDVHRFKDEDWEITWPRKVVKMVVVKSPPKGPRSIP